MHLENTKKEIQLALRAFLSSREEVIFAYLFGSFVNRDAFRDIDVGVYLQPVPELTKLGTMQSDLDSELDHPTDLVLMNGIPDKNPKFAYEIVTQGDLLLNQNPPIHTVYKSKVFRYYFDTAYLRKETEGAFDERLKTNKFGLRNYE